MQVADRRVKQVAAPIREQVLEGLREAIVNGEFEPGRRLVESELCALFGVSRPPVREALRQLDAEGFVSTLPNRGPVVAQLDRKAVADLYEVRAMMEAQAASLFAERASDGQIQDLRACFLDVEKAYTTGTVGDRIAAKTRFYKIMMEGADNETLMTLFELINARTSMARRNALSSQDRLPQSLSEIRGIVDAVSKRDAALAFSLSSAHVKAAAEAALALVEH